MSERGEKISIIITVYNRESTIRKCIESALCQTMKDIELVIVDDCSTDSSVEVIREYAAQHSNILLIINKQNMGPGYAKNRGLNAARGEFATFLDSDDYLPDNYLENLYDALKKTEADIAVADLAFVEDEKITVHTISEFNIALEFAELAAIPSDNPSLISGMVVAGFWGGSSACTKLARRKLWLDYPFYEKYRCDDLPAVLPMLAAAKRIVHVPKCQYNYVQSQASVERKHSIEKDIDALDAIGETLKRYSRMGAQRDCSQILAISSLFATIHGFLLSDEVVQDPTLLAKLCLRLSHPPYPELLSEESNPFWEIVKRRNVTPSQRMLLFMLPLLALGKSEEFTERVLQWRALTNKACPKVSIVIPVYNGANYMRDAIESALAQTYENIEIIVVNDGSNDGGETDKIARSYGNRIRYFCKENGGVATALNMGISKMTGEYFSWLSHDDMYTPEKVEQELKWLAIQPDWTTIIAEGYQVVDALGNYMYTVNLHNQYTAEQLEKPMFSIFRGGINGCALLIHKSHFERVGLFRADLPTTQDYDLWFRMFQGQKIYYTPSSNVLSRCHDEQGSKALVSSHVIECDRLWIGMMEGLDDQTRIEQDGSVYLFFKGVRDFLQSTTGYRGAIEYARQKTFCAAVQEYDKTHNKKLTKEIAEGIGYDVGLLNDVLLPLRVPKHSKQRIIFFLPLQHEGGGLNRVVLQVSGLLSSRYDVLVLSIGEKLEGGDPTPPGVQELYLPWGIYRERGYIRLCYLLGADLIIASHNCDEAILPFYAEAKQFGIRSIAWNHEFYLLPYWNRALFHCLNKRNEALAEADAVVWLDQFSAAAYELFQDNGVCLPNPCTLSSTQMADDADGCHDAKMILSVGRFDDPHKDLTSLLRMFSYVAAEEERAELYIVGHYDLGLPVPDTPQITYQKLIYQLHIPEDKLHFVGWTEKVDEYYQKTAVQVLPSLHEGFGLVILEAAVYGVPSIVYGGSGMDGIITNGQDGIVVPSGDWGRLGVEVLSVLRDYTLRTRLSDEVKHLPEKYAPDTVREKWCDVINAVLYRTREERNEYFAQNYRKPLSDREDLYLRIIKQYESCISQLTEGGVTEAEAAPSMAATALSSGDDWAAECIQMQQSLSWRITKPLRLIKKVVVIWKAEGFAAMLQKIRQKLRGGA